MSIKSSSIPHLARATLTAFVLVSLLDGTAGDARTPLPPGKDLPGVLQFHGHYRHRSRGVDIPQPGELWVSQMRDGSVAALAHLPFMNLTEMVSGDTSHRPTVYRVRRTASGAQPGYSIDLECHDGKAHLTRRGVREDCDAKELTVPADACFDPNSRPDSYCAANILLRQFRTLTPAEPKAIRVFDWDATGEALADYTIQVVDAGREEVQVPAGTFDARHLVLTQTTSANTWFKKRAGHTTDFWVVDNGIIIRLLRHREPYEMLLLDYDLPARLPGSR